MAPYPACAAQGPSGAANQTTQCLRGANRTHGTVPVFVGSAMMRLCAARPSLGWLPDNAAFPTHDGTPRRTRFMVARPYPHSIVALTRKAPARRIRLGNPLAEAVRGYSLSILEAHARLSYIVIRSVILHANHMCAKWIGNPCERPNAVIQRIRNLRRIFS